MFALLVDSSAAIAQTSEPTVAQANQFITSQVEQFGRSSCYFVNGRGDSTDRSESSLIKIGGDRLTIQSSSLAKTREQGTRSADAPVLRRIVASFLLSDVHVSLTDSQLTNDHQCAFRSGIQFSCPSDSPCVTVTDLVGLTEDGQQQQGITEKHERSSSGASLAINDEAMAGRILAAVNFYKTHLPASSASPF